MSERFHGDRLRYARLLATLSLDEVGELVSASRQYIHQLETGAKVPAPEMRLALAAALGVRESFFEKPLVRAVAESDCHFRRLLTAPRAVLAHAAARGTFVEQLVASLEARKVKLPRVDFPYSREHPKNFQQVEEAAATARIYWKLGEDAPIKNMTRVLERAGALVVSFGDISDRIDALSISRGRPLVVRSDAKESGARARFDLAHECGHLIMHQGMVTGDEETEGQANRFASAFLLPAKAFAREYPRGQFFDWQALYALKVRWKVSVRAIVRRAYDLSLIDAAQYRSANVYLSKSGQTKRERFDEEVPKELPEVLPAALKLLAERNFAELVMLVEELSLTPARFQRLTEFELPDFPDNLHVLNC